MKLVLAPDSFKGSLSSMEVIHILSKVAKEYYRDLEIVKIPVADGGEGTLKALLTPVNGRTYEIEVTSPLGSKVKAHYGIYNDTFLMEMAQASGLTLVDRDKRNPLKTTSYGTGELIKRGLDLGYRKIVLGIGGSATNDGGIGALSALGIRFLDRYGNVVPSNGEGLILIENMDLEDFDKRIFDTEIIVMCDVNNPLTGDNGATFVYGRQKGASEEMLHKLEAGMIKYKHLIFNRLGIDLDKVKGAGAAGGIGGALSAFCRAELKPGIDTLMDFIDFDSLVNDADIVITGEGKIDIQSTYGKVVCGIAKRCKTKYIPVVALCGGIDGNINDLYDLGVQSIMPITRSVMDIEYAINNAAYLLEDAAHRMFKFININI